jgi:hypothetical protein
VKTIKKFFKSIGNTIRRLDDKGQITLENLAAATTVAAIMAVVVTATSGNAIEDFEEQAHLQTARVLTSVVENYINSENLTPALGSSSEYTVSSMITAGKLSEAITDPSSQTTPKAKYSSLATKVIVENVSVSGNPVLRFYPVLVNNAGDYNYVNEDDGVEDRTETRFLTSTRVAIPANDSTGR